MRASLSASTPHPPPWRWAVRVSWLVFALLLVGLFGVALPARFAQLRSLAILPPSLRVDYAQALQQVGLSVSAYALVSLLPAIFNAVLFLVVACAIFWRKPDDWMALFVSCTLLLLGANFAFVLRGLAWADARWQVPVVLFYDLGRLAYLSFFYLFPDGRFTPRWTRELAVVLLIWTLLWTCFPAAPWSPATWPPLLWLLVRLAWFSSGLWAQLYRYVRVSGPVQRQQNKWVVVGLGVDTAIFFGFSLAGLLFPALTAPTRLGVLYDLSWLSLTTFSLALVPLTIAVAILRYHLWDIDLLIRRTLLYSGLTLLLVLVYFTSVVVLQRFLQTFTGQEQSPVVTVLSTLAIAALFTPLRRRLQAAIDRRFYRQKYNTEQVLATFHATIRDETNLERLTAGLQSVVATTLQPTQVSLWLRETHHPPAQPV